MQLFQPHTGLFFSTTCYVRGTVFHFPLVPCSAAERNGHKYDLKALADAMAAEVASHKIDVRLNAQVAEQDLQGYDQIICAVGSSPLTPPIPGLADCLPALKAYEPEAPIGQSVILLGGGLVGCETAVHLAKNGRKVTIVEMRANPTDELEAMAANAGVPMVKIGDCQKARKIFDAIEEGWQVAMNVG